MISSELILAHLLAISSGSCNITDQMIKDEPDFEAQQVLSGLLMLFEDIQYKKQLHDQALEEKELLLKENHHRVKNNLQIMKSLLALQSANLKDEQLKMIFQKCQFRINSIALAQESMHNLGGLTKVRYNDYISNLSGKLISSIKGTDNNIELIVDVPELNLNIDTVTPLGLIINEVVSNALYHGIKGDDQGEIRIQIKQKEEQTYTLKISDNGNGFNDGFDISESNSLGLKLITNLSKQLKGFTKIDTTTKGVGYIITFVDN